MLSDGERDGYPTLALYSPGRKPVYRYAFAWWWNPAESHSLGDSVAWVLLNPSTGDSDGRPRPVLSYCRKRSEAWGYTGLVIVNLLAYRDRDPRKLREPLRAGGPDNDTALEIITGACALTVAAWGDGGAKSGRSAAVRPLLKNPHCLLKDGRNTSQLGQPFYPRGIARDANPVPLPRT